MTNQLLLLGLVLLVFGCQNQATVETKPEIEETPINYQTTGSIERLSPKLEDIISSDASIEILAEGFKWSEGPLWLAEQNAVIFSDIPNNRIMKWSEEGGLEAYLKPAGYTGEVERGGEGGSNGLLLDKEGNLILCQHGNRQIAKMDAPLDAPESAFSVLADKYDGKRLNSPNDAAFHSNGDLYFTDPPYGLEGQMEDPAKEIDFQGVYRLSNGEVSLLTDEFTRPNGIAFSPDEKTVYVANSDPEKAIWMQYDVEEDGKFSNGKLFFDVTSFVKEGKKGLPDGLKVAKDGTIFATGPGGVLIFSSEGEHLGTVNTGQPTSNCAFDSNEKTLYMTANMYLMRVKLK